MRRVVKALGALVVGVAMVVALAPAAYAHDPIFITADQTTPDTGPFMPDGSISWALYGSVLSDGDTRGFEFDLRDGDEVFVSLLIPNLAPEVDLADSELPIVELEAPDGSMTTITPEIREVFEEPFSNTSYVTLAEYRQPAQAGRYRGLIVGSAPARFSVAIGETEIFFTETERSGDRPSNFAEITVPLAAWYTTLPGGEPDTNALADGEAEIDLDMIEDAMDSGVAQAPEGSLDEEGDAESAPEDEAAADEPEPDTDTADTADTDTAETGAAAADTAEAEAESDTSETANAANADDGSATTWVAPVIIGAVVVVGGAAFLVRRGRD